MHVAHQGAQNHNTVSWPSKEPKSISVAVTVSNTPSITGAAGADSYAGWSDASVVDAPLPHAASTRLSAITSAAARSRVIFVMV